MRGRTFLKTLGAIVLLAWNPVAFLIIGTAAGVTLGVRGARKLGEANRMRQVIPPAYVGNPQRNPILQNVPIEQRDWAQRNPGR